MGAAWCKRHGFRLRLPQRHGFCLRLPQTEMGAGIAASPHCAERRICRSS